MTKTKPVAGLVPGAPEYFETVARPAVALAIQEPANAALALAAFTLLYHVKDWACRDKIIEGELAYWSGCPFAQVVAEIANGGKHGQVTDGRLTSSPHVLEFRICGYGDGGWGVGPFGVHNIQVHGKRTSAEEPRWWSIKEVLETVSDWWRSALRIT